MADDADTLSPSDTDNNLTGDPRDEVDQSNFVGFQRWYREARDFSHQWRTDSREWYAFRAGDQWSEDDAAQLKDQLRPVITFNRIDPVINTVAGLEIGNRQDVAYIPRQIGSQGVNDLLTEAARFFRGECDAEDEESEAFIDLVVCGMGWTETRLDYDVNPQGMIDIPRIDPLEMYWDPSAKKKNLGDRRYHCRVKDVPIMDAREQFPGFDDNDLDARWADDTGVSADPHDAQQAPFYRNDQSGKIDRDRHTVRLVEFEWWEYEVNWHLIDPFTQQLTVLKADDFDTLIERLKTLRMPEPTAVKMRKKIYFRNFLGAKVLKKWRGPDEGFVYKVMTGTRERNKNTWYGLVKAMMDPQRWANKWLSQGLHILNTGAKGGIIAEEDAFDDWDDALEDWASPDSIVKAAVGAISGEKIKDRPTVAIPAGYENMMTLAISSIRDCTGVNMELLGQVGEDQPGIVEHLRKQAGLTVLATLFNSLRRYRKEQGRLLLYFLTNFLSDGRLIRIGGAEDAQYVPLVRQSDTVEYDVIVDEMPTSPNMKEQIWGTLTGLFPFMQKLNIPPQGYLELMKYSPLPASVVAKFEQAVKSAPPPPPNPKLIEAQSSQVVDKARAALLTAQANDLGTQGQLDQQRIVAENAKTQVAAHQSFADLQSSNAETELKRSTAILNIAKAEAAKAGIPLDRLMAVVNALDTFRQAHQDQQGLSLDAAQMRQDDAHHNAEMAQAAQQPEPAAA